jgi:hypothetical protein
MAGFWNTRFFAVAGAAAILGAGIVQAQDAPSALDDAVGQMDQAGQSAGEGAAAGRIAADFTAFSGSEGNADALVRGLRNGSEITLEQDGTSTRFTPATGHLGYGGVSISLSLAKALLGRDGIEDPSPAQIAAALNGGDVTLADGSIVSYSGILAQRADGAGWGQIAKAEGFKLGPVIATIRSGKDHLSRLQARDGNTAEKTGRPDKPQQAAKPASADKPERANRADRPDRPEKPMRAERPEKPERPMRVERPEKPERPGKS